MPKILPIQNDFTAGILSPRLHSRSNIDAYRSGVADAVNFVALRQGPMETRGGFRHLESFTTGRSGKLFSFQLAPGSSLGEGFPVIIDDSLVVTVYGATSAVSGANIIANPDFSGGGASWDTVGDGNVNFNGNVARVTADSATATGVSQRIDVEQNTVYPVEVFSPSPNADIFPRTRISIGTTMGGTDILDETSNLQTTFDSGTNTAVWINVTLEPGVYIPVIDDLSGDTTTATAIRDISSVSVRAPSTETQRAQFSPPAVWAGLRPENFFATMAPDGNTMYILSGASVPYKLEYDATGDTWTLTAVAFTDPPSDWSGTNWPSTMTFFQDRTWWGGVPSTPNSFFASQTGEYEILTVGANANDGLSFILSRRGTIQWMEGARNLLIGTTNGEYIITSSSGVITPDDIQVEQQSANGAARVSSELIGNLALYTSLDGRKLRSTIFRWNEQAWVSRDLTFSAEHLTEQSRITEISYAKDPESIIWCTTSDGALLGCTFEPYSEQLGWHRHVTDGTVVSTTVLETSEGSMLYALINRGGRTRLEIMDQELYVDGGAIQNTTGATTAIAPLAHLANRTVSVVVDGSVHPSVILDEDGSGVLQWEGRQIQVGLPFTASLITLVPDYGSLRGSAMNHVKRWNEITVRTYASRAPLINGRAAPERSTETPMDTPEPVGNFDITVKNVTWGDGRITVTQELPVKTRISGIFGELNQENL